MSREAALPPQLFSKGRLCLQLDFQLCALPETAQFPLCHLGIFLVQPFAGSEMRSSLHGSIVLHHFRGLLMLIIDIIIKVIAVETQLPALPVARNPQCSVLNA